ncbi:hypothetical protein FPV67DRAFT_1431184, partial [Lyophyllum atratum]
EDCSRDLVNARGGVFCARHEAIMSTKCLIKGCNNSRVEPTKACQIHQSRWSSHITRFGRQTLLGVRRLLRRAEEEAQPWLPATTQHHQPHDTPAPENQGRDNYFTPSRFYCVETLCAPCGVVIAWTKFAKAESPTNILNWLNEVYPTPDVRPNYVCIDKACLVLRTAINNGFWDIWQETTRFIVDAYHYINHRTTDYLCRKWCNPAPLNGSAPNLVLVETDRQGRQHYKRAFNTQACEQLNAWLGGFQAILNKMTVDNFNWTLHALLFLHTKKVIALQKARETGKQGNSQEEEDEDDDVDMDVEDI